jgi:hypothetical protein
VLVRRLERVDVDVGQRGVGGAEQVGVDVAGAGDAGEERLAVARRDVDADLAERARDAVDVEVVGALAR